MASSGTVSNPSVTFRFKPQGHESVMIAGRMITKSQAIVEAGDLSLRTIRSFNLTQRTIRDIPGGCDVLYGSVNTGSLGNSVTITALRGSIKIPAGGTWHVGTIRAGTQRISFWAEGA